MCEQNTGEMEEVLIRVSAKEMTMPMSIALVISD